MRTGLLVGVALAVALAIIGTIRYRRALPSSAARVANWDLSNDVAQAVSPVSRREV
jgi:hypothetical protein